MPDDRKPPDEKLNNRQDESQRPGDENQFIAFRRYADEQVSSILNAFGLPLSWNAQHWNDERIQEFKFWTTERKTPGGKHDAASSSPQDPPSWLKIWAPDGREIKPKVVENDYGNKTYHWSKSWAWPSKESAKTDESNALDATQKQAVEEARRNAENEMQELSNILKSFFGIEEEKAAQDQPKSSSALDWVWPSQHKSNPEKGVGISKEAFPQQQSKSSREKLWGRHEEQGVADIFHGHHGFPPFAYFHGPRFGPHRFADCRMRWLLSHPYSPVVLEAEKTKSNIRGPDFVDAFEDLLRVEQGLPIDERWAWERDMWPRRMRLMSILHSSHAKTQEFWNNMREGGDWYIAKRGLKPLQERAKLLSLFEASKDETVAPQKSSSEEHDQAYERFLGSSSSEPKTELDAYEQALGSDSASSPVIIKQTQTQPHTKHQSAIIAETPTPEVVEASPILSTVTSTERTVLPDGTVTTRVVFRKRFADGREESSETVNTTRGDAASPAPEAALSESTSSGGWFWSK